MKSLLLFILFSIAAIGSASAQKVEKYFQLSTFFKNKGINVIIDLGKDSSLFAFKDKAIKPKILLATRYSTTVDVINYITSLGWTVQNSFASIVNGDTVGYTFFFKRTFDESEIIKATNE